MTTTNTDTNTDVSTLATRVAELEKRLDKLAKVVEDMDDALEARIAFERTKDEPYPWEEVKAEILG
ncbi:MAG: hypothetical protein WBV90_07480 [Terrimicrobiaceae bacterium]